MRTIIENISPFYPLQNSGLVDFNITWYISMGLTVIINWEGCLFLNILLIFLCHLFLLHILTQFRLSSQQLLACQSSNVWIHYVSYHAHVMHHRWIQLLHCMICSYWLLSRRFAYTHYPFNPSDITTRDRIIG